MLHHQLTENLFWFPAVEKAKERMANRDKSLQPPATVLSGAQIPAPQTTAPSAIASVDENSDVEMVDTFSRDKEALLEIHRANKAKWEMAVKEKNPVQQDAWLRQGMTSYSALRKLLGSDKAALESKDWNPLELLRKIQKEEREAQGLTKTLKDCHFKKVEKPSQDNSQASTSGNRGQGYRGGNPRFRGRRGRRALQPYPYQAHQPFPARPDPIWRRIMDSAEALQQARVNMTPTYYPPPPLPPQGYYPSPYQGYPEGQGTFYPDQGPFQGPYQGPSNSH